MASSSLAALRLAFDSMVSDLIQGLGDRVRYAAWRRHRQTVFVQLPEVGLTKVYMGVLDEVWFVERSGKWDHLAFLSLLIPLAEHGGVLRPWSREGSDYWCGFFTGATFARLKCTGSTYMLECWWDGGILSRERELSLEQGVRLVQTKAKQLGKRQPWPEIFPWLLP